MKYGKMLWYEILGVKMMDIRVSKDRSHFECDGNPIFLLGDTIWTAFSNTAMDEWEEYLDYRNVQGFNMLQINILTQWDAGKSDLDIYPFGMDEQGKFDFGSINEEYFERAQKMLEIAVGKGFIPALVVLCGNYVKDTTMSDKSPINIMPLGMVRPYVEYAVTAFRRYRPIYIVSGDADFRTETTTKYYMTAINTIRELDPGALITAHLYGGVSSVPQPLAEEGALDFYMYQSSHNIESQNYAYTLAESFYNSPVKKPIMNGEPCYENHSFGDNAGRYDESQVRRAVWQSLLSGAKAGVTYGAHGLWGRYSSEKEFFNLSYSGKPLNWRKALRFRGAWDVSFAKWIFETFGLFDIEPKQSSLINDTKEIRLSASKDLEKIAVYVPYNTDVRIDMDLSEYEFTVITLADKCIIKPVVIVENDVSTIRMHEFGSDAVIIGTKELA
jgi:hypothetical protein